jgi:hypothetical protein
MSLRALICAGHKEPEKATDKSPNAIFKYNECAFESKGCRGFAGAECKLSATKCTRGAKGLDFPSD